MRRERQKGTWIDEDLYREIQKEAVMKGQKVVYVVNSVFRERYGSYKFKKGEGENDN